MKERAARQAQQQEEQFRSYVQSAAGWHRSADQMAKLADLCAQGVISATELGHEQEKAKVLT